MIYFKYFIIALIQGITEPLPISSSGHMQLFKAILNTNIFNNLSYEIVCNFGSFIAIFIIFRKDIFKLIKSFFKFIFYKENEFKDNYQFCLKLNVSTIPVVILGFILKNIIETKFNNIYFLGFSFLITAFLLFIVRNSKGLKTEKDITYKDSIIIGLFQTLALFPGISRSGTVLVACLLCGLNKALSLKYTFLLYLPVSIGALILGINDIIIFSEFENVVIIYLIGIIISGIITFLSYDWLVNWLKKEKLINFSFYCIFLALIIFLFFR